MSAFALLLALAGAQDASPPPEAQDIIVRATGKRRCRIEFADRAMSDREFDRRAAEWAAGTPVRVVASRRADIKCLAKIAFRLGDRGVRLIEFVTPAQADAEAGAIPIGR